MLAGRISDRINVKQQNIGGGGIRSQLLERTAWGVGQAYGVMRIQFFDYSVGPDHRLNRSAAPLRFVHVLPQQKPGVVPETVDDASKHHFLAGIIRFEAGEFSQARPAKQSVLSYRIHPDLFRPNDRLIPRVAKNRSRAKERSAAVLDFSKCMSAIGCSSIGWWAVAESDRQHLPAVDNQNTVFVDRHSWRILGPDL